MTFTLLFDVLLVALLLGSVAYGLTVGLRRGVFAIGGIVAGIVSALLLAPVISRAIPAAEFRSALTFAASIGIIVIGYAIGRIIGRSIGYTVAPTHHSKLVTRRILAIDRVAGGVAAGALATLLVSTVSFSVAPLGAPWLSRTLADSSVVRAIRDVTPADARIEIARLRAVISNDGATFFSSGLRLSGAETPTIDTDNADLAESAQSAVRISGISYACGQVKTATGFVVADERVVTNAHVVAGSKRPAVEALNGQVLIGTVVYFNAQDDLAVIAVPGLAVAPLKMGITARADTPAAFEGFPFGGPLSVQAAHIERVGTISSPNIYDSGGSAREVYIFAGDVNHGDSGGPLLSLKGDVIGVIFARSSAQENVGYAMTQTELKPVVDIAKTLTSKVSSGACIFD